MEFSWGTSYWEMVVGCIDGVCLESCPNYRFYNIEDHKIIESGYKTYKVIDIISGPNASLR